MALVNVYTVKLDFLNQSNAILIDPTEFTEDFSVYDLTQEDNHLYEYELVLADKAFKGIEGEEYKLIINGIQDNAVKVWFNDELIVSEGDLKEGLSVMRSGYVDGSIESSTVQTNNILRVQTYADYRTGTKDQIIISEKQPGERAVRLLALFQDQSIYLGLGLMGMSVLFLVIIYLLNRSGNELLLYLSLATFFAVFYFFDFLSINNLWQKYIVYKKLYLLCLSLAIFFYGKALNLLINKKYIMIWPTAQLLYYIVAMIIPKDMIQFKVFYDYFYSSLLVSVLFFILLAFLNRSKNNKIFILLLHFITLIISGIIRFEVGLKNEYFSLELPIFIMFTMSFLPMLMTFDLLLEKQLKIRTEQNLKEIAYEQSMIDDLTGVWNKRYLEKRLCDLKEKTVVALVDLDNLKEINDTYGHLAGDQMITTLTETMQRNLQREDNICRYGGDEFVVIFNNCDMDQAVKRLDQIREIMAEKKIRFNGSKINTTISAGLSIVTDKIRGEKVIQSADVKLYRAKEKGRNRIEYKDSSKEGD